MKTMQQDSRKPTLFSRALLFLVLFSASYSAGAADRYWVSTAASTWSNTGSWSATSGGAGGASVPGAADIAIFDGGGGHNGTCTFDAPVTVSGLRMTSGYSGSVVQGAFSLTVGSSSALLSGGTFTGGTADITMNGHLTLSGTAFTSTSGILTIGTLVNLSLTSGSFTHNNGTVQVNVRENTVTGNFDFYHFIFRNVYGPYHVYIAPGNTVVVHGNLENTGNGTTWIDNGTIEARGDIILSNTSGTGGGTALIVINGTGTQNLQGISVSNHGKLPRVQINKPSGTLNLSGSIAVGNHWTYTAGTVNAGTSRVIFSGDLTITGSLPFHEVEFLSVHAPYTFVIAAGTVLVANGTTYLSGSHEVMINGGTLEVKGDLAVTNSYNWGGGSATLLINNTTDQTITGSGTANRGRLPRVHINKPSGTLHLISVITAANDWTYTAGTLDPGTSRVVFANSLTITGSHTLHEVEFAAVNNSGSWITIASGTVLTVPAHAFISGSPVTNGTTPPVILNNGTVDVQSHLTITNLSQWSGGSALLRINGTGNQVLTGSGTSCLGSLPRVQINKGSGTLQLASIISSANDWTYTAGTLDPGTSRVVFDNHGTITGTQDLHEIEFRSIINGFTSTIANGTILTANGTLSFSGTPEVWLNTGLLQAKGDIHISNTSVHGGGTATILINGTGVQGFTSTSAGGQGRLPVIQVNKPAGQLTMSGVITVTGNWTYTAGAVDPGTSAVYFLNETTIDGEGPGGTMTFYDVTLGDVYRKTLAGNLVVAHTLALGTGKVILNGRTCSLTWSDPGAVTRTSGSIVSEATNNSSKLSWTIGSATGSYTYPFATTNSTHFIPLIFELTDGDAGIVTVSTYPTTTANTPFPVSPDAVTNMNRPGAGDNSSNTIDRFWQIDKSGASGTATVTYTYAPAEVTADVTGNQLSLRAQRYNTATNTWEAPRSGQVSTPASYSVVEPGITQFSPRVLAINNTPVPVRLVRFSAMVNAEKSVELHWVTAIESDNRLFELERSADGRRFHSFASVAGGGHSSVQRTYAATDARPLPATSYYRLRWLDAGGKSAYSKVVQVHVTKRGLQVVQNPVADGQLKVILPERSTRATVLIYNAEGKLVYREEHSGSFTVPTLRWKKGLYTVKAGTETGRFVIR